MPVRDGHLSMLEAIVVGVDLEYFWANLLCFGRLAVDLLGLWLKVEAAVQVFG